VLSERQGVEIDYCPECRGVWLDRGEIDKIIERSNSYDSNRIEEHSDRQRDTYQERNREDYYEKDKYHKKKRGGFLGDLLDFGD